MNIPKAIEIVELNLKEARQNMPPDCRNALKLLVEAGKEIQTLRSTPSIYRPRILPGETFD